MPKLSQETIAMPGIGIGLAALILTATTGLQTREPVRDAEDSRSPHRP